MAERNATKLNRLKHELPKGLLVDAAWLSQRGYSSSLRSHYLAAGWLVQPARGVFMRPPAKLGSHNPEPLRWELAIIVLQTLLDFPVIVGGRTALELQGYSHYLTREQTEVHLYGQKRPPSWLHKLPLQMRFIFHKSDRVFRNDPITRSLTNLSWNLQSGRGVSADSLHGHSLTKQPWGHWDWPLTLSTPERAVLELLDELPSRESFHQADKLMEGLANLSPRRMQMLLEDCRSVKVKRLFFFLAERHGHAWLRRIERARIDLGEGKRMLVRGGRLDPTYEITVPRDLDGVP